MSPPAQDPAAFLREQGWQFRLQGDELRTGCPFCEPHGGHHLYVNKDSGAWRCVKCDAAGSLRQLQERLGLTGNVRSIGQALQTAPKRIPQTQVDTLHAALLADPEALAYCTETRRWSLEIIKRFRIGLRVDGRGKWLSYPAFRGAFCVLLKYRLLPAYVRDGVPRFEREPGCETVLFNGDALSAHEEVILCSGESDCLALLTLGFSNSVAATSGEGSLPAAVVDALRAKAKTWIAYDNDAAGAQGAKAVAERIGLERAWLVRFPDGVKDVAEYLEGGGSHNGFLQFLEDATQVEMPSIFDMARALDLLDAEAALGPVGCAEETTPWPSLNRALGIWHPGRFVVLGAPMGTGKTTLLLNIAKHWAERGLPSLLYCLEMTIAELMAKTLRAHYHLPQEENEDLLHLPPAILEQARADLVDTPLYLGANPWLHGLEQTMAFLRMAVRRYGLKLLIFDNLNFLVRSTDSQFQEIGLASKAFRTLALEMQIVIVLVAQPRKLNDPNQVMAFYDFWGGQLHNDASQLIVLHRDRLASRKGQEATRLAGVDPAPAVSPVTVVRLEKGRTGPERDTLLYYIGAESRFREMEDGDLPAEQAPVEPARSPYAEPDEELPF